MSATTHDPAGPGSGGPRPLLVARDPLLVARDPLLVEAVLSAAAAAGVQPHVVRDASAVRAAWRSASQVVVGVEMAALVCGIALEPRTGVHLVGGDLAELGQWSSPLQASVLVLPQQSALLTSVLEQGAAGAGDARVVRLVGGSGGLGTSTLCCALAQQAARRGLAAAVVELDTCGGGLDLLLGAEREPGWRWPDLRSAVGHIGTLVGQLPRVAGVDVVSHASCQSGPAAVPRRGAADGWGGEAAMGPAVESVRAVLSSLGRTHDLVVLDAGRGADQLAEAWPGQRQLLVCGADARQLVAARARATASGLHDVELVVRTGAGRRIDPAAAADWLGIGLLGAVGDDGAVVRAVEAGAPPLRGRGRYARQVDALVDALVAA